MFTYHKEEIIAFFESLGIDEDTFFLILSGILLLICLLVFYKYRWEIKNWKQLSDSRKKRLVSILWPYVLGFVIILITILTEY